MTCPNCDQSASTFLRFSFSLQNVSMIQSAKGYFRCQHCGTLLRVGSYGKQFWILFGGAVVVLAAFILLYRRFFLLFGIGTTAAVWMILMLLIVGTITYGTWKFAQAGKVEEKSPATDKPAG